MRLLANLVFYVRPDVFDIKEEDPLIIKEAFLRLKKKNIERGKGKNDGNKKKREIIFFE